MKTNSELEAYKREELEEDARERTRSLEYDWHEYVFDRFEEACAIIGIAPRGRDSVSFEGSFDSGSASVSFEGRYRYAKGAAKAIRNHAPKEDQLHEIADALQTIQQRNLYQLEAHIRPEGLGRAQCVRVERNSHTGQEMTEDAVEIITETMHRLAGWLHEKLKQEYEALVSNEAALQLGSAGTSERLV